MYSRVTILYFFPSVVRRISSTSTSCGVDPLPEGGSPMPEGVTVPLCEGVVVVLPDGSWTSQTPRTR